MLTDTRICASVTKWLHALRCLPPWGSGQGCDPEQPKVGRACNHTDCFYVYTFVRNNCWFSDHCSPYIQCILDIQGPFHLFGVGFFFARVGICLCFFFFFFLFFPECMPN